MKGFWNFIRTHGCVLKYPAHGGWSELLFWYFYRKSFNCGWSHIMRVFPFIPSIVGVSTWILCAVLKAASRDLYFAVANKKPGSPGFSSGWHFSCHAIHFGLNWGWAGRLPAEKYHHSPQLETFTSRLGTVLHLEEDWISAPLDVFLPDCYFQSLS